MTDVTTGTEEAEPEFIELPAGDAAFAALMDVLAPHEYEEEAGAGGDPTPVAGEGTPAPAAPVEGAPAAGGEPAAPAAGAPVVPGVAESTAPDASTYDANWGVVLTALETRATTDLQAEATAEVRTEFAKYIEAIEQPASFLVGMKLPNPRGEGDVQPRDSKEAADWQEQIKYQLAQEVKDRASRKSDDVRPMMNTLTRSVELFRGNPDLIPNSKQFDKELADRFVELAEPYKLEVEGKFVGYTIDVSPMVKQVRAQLVRERTAAGATSTPPAPDAAAAPAPTPQQQRAAEQARAANGTFTDPDAPQVGIPSKAGSSSEDGEDLSTLWGTLGLPSTFRV